MAKLSTPGIVFYVLCLLNRNINQFSNVEPVLTALILWEGKKRLFFLIYATLRTEIHESSSFSVSAIRVK